LLQEDLKKFYEKYLESNLKSSPKERFPHPTEVKTDSRRDLRGKCFLPLVGQKFDAHCFIPEAFQKGALASFCQSDRQEFFGFYRDKVLFVHNTRSALHQIAGGWRRKFKKLPVIAITGSVGKTTCRKMLHCILSEKGLNHHTIKNNNNDIGVSLTLLEFKEAFDSVILEFGARHCGDILKLAQIAKPNIRLLTNIGYAHIGEFGGKKQLFNAKMELFQKQTGSFVAIAPGDQANVKEFCQNHCDNLITFGYSEFNHVQLIQTIIKKSPMSMQIRMKHHQYEFEVKLSHVHASYPYNVAAVTAVAVAAGRTYKDIIKGLAHFTPDSGRFCRYNLKEGLVLIDDSYNANPESLLSGLKTLAQYSLKKNLWIILGDMLELGDEAEYFHDYIGQQCVALVPFDKLIAVGKWGKVILGGANRLKNMLSKDMHTFASVDDLICFMQDIHLEDMVIYLKGSRATNLDKVKNYLLTTRGEL